MKNKNLKRRFYFTLSWLTLTIFFAVSIEAQTTAFNYQGRLTDAGAAQTSYQMEFRLFGSAAGADQIGETITNTNVSVNQGVFTVQLNFASPTLPGAAAFTGADRFLQISVRRSAAESFVTINPRQQITSSPYSIRTLSAAQADVALDSQKLGGVPASEYVTTTSVGNSFIKNATTQQTADFNISGNGIVGGTLGVGMNPGGFKFSVNGAGQFRPRGTDESLIGFLSNVTANVPTISLSKSDGSKAEMRLNGSSFQLVNGFGFGTPNDGITIARFGNVGIGTDAPATKLQIKTTSGDYGFTHTDGAISVGSYVGSSSSGATGGWLGTQSNNKLFFFTNNGQPSMTVDTTGNVGVGTINPNTRLTLSGGVPWTSAGWTASMNFQNASAFGWEANASNQHFGIGQSNGGLYFFRTNSGFGTTGSPANYDMVIQDNGNITQPITANGLVKAMIVYSALGTAPVRCYNGITNSTTGTCGFTYDVPAQGIRRVNFGFPVSNRFISITAEYASAVSCCNNNVGVNYRVVDSTSIDIYSFKSGSTDTTPAAYTIILY